ncbi:MAG: tRNA uridine-5-carboxymethylaminomethyl modification enzyme MnmG/GidA [Planctomycetota bacterium]
MRESYDVIVIGGGHAGTEAAWAAASALRADGCVALVTMDPSRIGQMSCNPAIGGLAKGQMVREIDAMGGIMGRAIDASGIMFKLLNTSKGAAVRGPRAQADKYAYAAEVQRLVASRAAIDVIAGRVDDLAVEAGRVVGVVLAAGAGVVRGDKAIAGRNVEGSARAEPVFPAAADEGARDVVIVRSPAVVLTTGTFMRGLMHTGEDRRAGGRVGEDAATGISATLRRLGFELGRLKTGTPPRLDRASIDWDGLDRQVGDERPLAFSDRSPAVLPAGRFPHLPQAECRLTATTAAAHDLIRANLHRAPMFTGQIEAECGPRYCPSIEDKVVRFADRPSHHVFLEPESLHTREVYCNGISTSLPVDVQERIVRAMPGCEAATILRWGYAVEYDMVWPHQIDATTMTRSVRGLFLAGQINCTTGYEEAGGQGVLAGLNAARWSRGDEPVALRRDQAYVGVMLDDLVTKTPREPYRMFTSRAEHRLLLRADNADERLTPWAREHGLVEDAHWREYEQRAAALQRLRLALGERVVAGRRLRELARRPDVTMAEIVGHLDEAPDGALLERVVTEARYDGYLARQRAELKRQQRAEHQRIPEWIDYRLVTGLRAEAADVLARFRPRTIGQAGRLAGVNPADLTLVAVAVRRGPEAAAAARPD